MDGKTLALASVIVVAFGSVVLAAPPVRRFLSPQAGGENVYDAGRDPAAGTLFRLPSEDAFGQPVPSSPRTIVVIAGGCTSCSLHAIDPRQVVPTPGEIIVFAYQTSRKDLPSWMGHLPSDVRVLADEDARLQKAANSAWQPRYVVLDAQHRIVTLSKDDAGVPEYVQLRRRG